MEDLIDIMKEDLDTYIAEMLSVCCLRALEKEEIVDTYQRVCKMKVEMEHLFKGLEEYNIYE